MSAINKTFSITLDTKRPPSNREFECIVGDTGNVLNVELFDDGTPVDLSDAHVIVVFSNKNGTYLQDQLEDDGGVTVSGENHNIINIALHAPAYASGVNEVEIQVWTDADGDDADDTLITTARFNFSGKTSIVNEDTVKASAEYPILVRLINEAQTAINDAENASSLAGASAEQADNARDAALLAKESADNAAASASGSASAANALILKLSNPAITIENGDAPSATVVVTETGIEFHLVVQKGADGRPAEIGDEAGILVETGVDGVLVAGRKMLFGEDAPEDVEELREGDIYFKESDDFPIKDVQVNGSSIADENGIANINAQNANGVAFNSSNKNLYVQMADSTAISQRQSNYKPIVPSNLNTAVKAALSDANRISDMTAAEKANARGVIGAVGGIDWTLVWENPDPTSQFTDQSVNTPLLAGCDFAFVAGKLTTSTSFDAGGCTIPLGIPSDKSGSMVATNATHIFSRSVSIPSSNTSVRFFVGYMDVTSGDGYMIPTKVYGGKLK